MKKFSVMAVAASFAAVCSLAQAESISVSQVGAVGLPSRAVSAAEAGGGAPSAGDIYQYHVTTDADILSVFAVSVSLENGAELYQHPAGTNTEPGNPAVIGALPALGADSWITTPGATLLLGVDLPGDGLNTTFGDTSSDGPQTDFMFAQLTVPQGTRGTFSGQISIAGATGPFNQSFSFPIGIPEPASVALAGLGLIGMIAARRRAA